MDIVRKLIAIVCVAYGAVTFIGFFTFILPRGGAPVIDTVLSLCFAGLFVLGGLLALFKHWLAIPALVASCILYLVAGLWRPVAQLGVSALDSLSPEFYYSLLFRITTTVLLIILIRRHRVRAETSIT